MTQFQIRRDDFARQRIADAETEGVELQVGDILLRISRFAFTANNITYAAAGDMLGYWQFFPPVGEDVEGWGVIPVWGFAEVIESNAVNIPVGEKLFGYFPPATTVRMTPTRVSDDAFIDGAAHRSKLPAGYNRYRRVAAEPGYDPATDDERMLLWPLYATAFCLGDALEDNSYYGARQVLIPSASSKTSIGLAYALSDAPGAPVSIGLTSARNLEFVKSLGVYGQVLTYDQLEDVDAGKASVIVDMSGNTDVLAALHVRLGDNMKFTVNVGLTHWDQTTTNKAIIADRSEFFFAPGHIQKRAQDWGLEEFERRSSEFVNQSVARSRNWLSLQEQSGLDGLARVYDDVCKGKNPPDQGIIIKMV